MSVVRSLAQVRLFPNKRCKNATRHLRPIFVQCIAAVAFLSYAESASAQRAKENAVAEASDAFGTSVGREEIGLYSSGSARGFSPMQAGNLRIDGLYYDQAQQARLNTRVVRGSSVHVGIAAQGYPFPAPTGVIDYHLRIPGDETAGGVLLGYGSYDQAYAEADFQAPVGGDVLSIGGGVGYARNNSYRISERSWEWSAGALARWQPNDALVVTPFWSYTDHEERADTLHVLIGNSGYPRYRPVDADPQSWADYAFKSGNYGFTTRYAPEGGWSIDAGVFRSTAHSPVNYDPLLRDTNSLGQGTYAVSAVPPARFGSTSGEVRFAQRFDTEVLRNTFYASFKARDRSSASGGADTIVIGPGSIWSVPQIAKPAFNLRQGTVVKAEQATPALGYDGVWAGVGQLSLGLQKTFYHRTVAAPAAPVLSGKSRPWLYNVAAAGYLSTKFVVYGSFTRGFEEIGSAPLNAANRDEVVPAQLTKQLDAGVRYLVTPRLTLVAGVFKIEKPYFGLDAANFYRQLGTTSNKGAEISLAGNITDELTIVAGGTFIDPKVQATTGTSTAVGPVPGLVRVNVQYRPHFLEGLAFDAKVESTSARDATATIRLPSAVVIDAGARYTTMVAGRNVTARLQTFNLTNAYVLTPSDTGRLQSLDGRRFELSLAVDF